MVASFMTKLVSSGLLAWGWL